jgi:predicted small secreted protein
MTPHSCALVVALSWLLSGCWPTEGAARDAFVQQHSCPADRVVAHRRDDVKAYDVIYRDDKPIPPANIAKDPERLALWQKAHDRSGLEANINRGNWVYEVQGCNIHVLSVCHQVQKHIFNTSCHEYPLPSGANK